MSKAQLPISYIIAILLGVFVLALLGYWFFITGGQFSGASSEADCRGRFVQYCIAWSTCNYDYDDVTTEEKIEGCQPGRALFFSGNKDCESIRSRIIGEEPEITACKKLLRQA